MVSIRFVSITVLLVAAGSCVNALSRPRSKMAVAPSKVTKKSSTSLSFVAAMPRGGAGPLDPELTAKVFTIVSMAQGLLMNVGPKVTLDQYGVVPNDGFNQSWMSSAGTGVLSYCIMLYCLLFKATTLETAVQAMYLPWVYNNLRNLLGGDYDKFKLPGANGKEIAGALVVFSFAIYAMTQDYAPTAIKALCALWILSGVQMVAAPKSALKSWGMNDSLMNDGTIAGINLVAFFFFASSAVQLSMLMLDATPLQAAGYGNVCWCIYHLYEILSGNVKRAGAPAGPLLVWAAMHAIIAMTTLL